MIVIIGTAISLLVAAGLLLKAIGTTADKTGSPIRAPGFIKAWWAWIDQNNHLSAAHLIVSATLKSIAPISLILTNLTSLFIVISFVLL